MEDDIFGVDEYYDNLSDYNNGPLEPIESQDPHLLELEWDDNPEDYNE